MAVRQLTPEEEAKPYAKYYHRPVTPPDPDLIAQIKPDEQIDPALALPPERISDLLDPGYHEVETGWCIMPNGTGYLAVHNRMPGVTVEMLDWWFWWHSMASLRYGLWYPPGHYGISISKKSRARLSDPDVPAKEKIYGRTDHVVEDIGTGAEDIYISFCAPEQMGFDMSRFHAPNVAAVYGGFGFDQPQGAKPSDIRAPAIMCHFIREIDGGSRVPFALLDGLQAHRRQARVLHPAGRVGACRGALRPRRPQRQGVLQPQVAAARGLGGVQGRGPGALMPRRQDS